MRIKTPQKIQIAVKHNSPQVLLELDDDLIKWKTPKNIQISVQKMAKKEGLWNEKIGVASGPPLTD